MANNLSSCSLPAVKAYYIPTGSMEPTLAINDWVYVDRNAYITATPQRGDIVVFKPSEALQYEGFKDVFIKRIFGLPGEQVSLVNGLVYINGQALAELYLRADTQTKVDICAAKGWLDSPQKILPNHYFMLGNNRNNAFDSRC